MNTKLATKIIKNSNYSTGYSLVEVLISLVLGILVTTGIFQVYLSNKQSYRLVEGQSRLQENARFAMSFLTEDIRLAGYTGCVSRGIAANSILNTPTDYLYNLAAPLQGFEWDVGSNNWAAQPGGLPVVDPSISNVLNATISDIITVRRAASQGFLVSNHPDGAADVTYTNNTDLPPLDVCDLVVVSNCSAATLFQISAFTVAFQAAHAAGGGMCALQNASADLIQSYVGGQLYSYQNTSYFIRNFQDPRNGQLIPTLYRVVNALAVQQLVEGIERMQIVYGVDLINDGSADQFFNADQFSPTTVGGPNWNQVVSVRISLLVASIEGNLVRQPTAINFNGVAVNVADGRLRRQFTTTIAIRNTLR